MKRILIVLAIVMLFTVSAFADEEQELKYSVDIVVHYEDLSPYEAAEIAQTIADKYAGASSVEFKMTTDKEMTVLDGTYYWHYNNPMPFDGIVELN